MPTKTTSPPATYFSYTFSFLSVYRVRITITRVIILQSTHTHTQQNTTHARCTCKQHAQALRCTVFGKHCECIAQKCTHLERLPPLASHLLLLSHCVLTRHGGKKINSICSRRESNLDLKDFRLMYLTSILLEQSYPMGRTVSANK